MPRFPFGETVILHSRTVTGTDTDGNDVYTATDTTYTKIAVYPKSLKGNTGEIHDAKQDTAALYIEAIMPLSATIQATDTATVYGTDWEVFGIPISYKSPLTGTRFQLVELVRYTG